MAKRRAKRIVKHSASSPANNIDADASKKIATGKEEDAFRDEEVERRTAAIRAIRDVEIDNLLTGLRLLRSNFNKEQLQTPVLLFFEDNLPNLSVQKTRKGQYEVQWKDKDGNLSMNQADGRNIHAPLLHQMSITYSDCSAAMPSFGGFEFSSKAMKASVLGSDNLQIKDFEPAHTQVLGLPDAFQTPGVSGHRLSVGMTPKTLRLPKHGEMLLSVHGSPLGVYKEDMEAIHEEG
ncbi:hypothetical protein NMG60_11007236 [Bertholletia excelsa]